MYKNYTGEIGNVDEITEGCDIRNINVWRDGCREIIDIYGINFQYRYNMTIIMRAYMDENFEFVKLLLKDENINVNLQNDDGWTILMLASRNGDYEIAELLLNIENIDVNIRDNDGNTALMWACRCENFVILKTIDCIMNNYNGIIEYPDGWDDFLKECRVKNDEIVKMLLKIDNIDIRCNNDWTFLAWVRDCENSEIIKLSEKFNK